MRYRPLRGDAMIANLPFTFDAARLQQRVKDQARAAGRIARRATKSAGHFIGACVVVVVSGGVAVHALLDVRKPDAVLLHQAIVKANEAAAFAAYPSSLHERDAALMMLAGAVLFMVAGF